MFQALEENYYISNNETFQFHEALYFVLVTIATIGKSLCSVDLSLFRSSYLQNPVLGGCYLLQAMATSHRTLQWGKSL